MPKSFVSIAIPKEVWEKLIRIRIDKGLIDTPLYKTVEVLCDESK